MEDFGGKKTQSRNVKIHLDMTFGLSIVRTTCNRDVTPDR